MFLSKGWRAVNKPRILILDRDPKFLEELAAVLSSAGFETITTVDTKSAERIFDRDEPNIAIFILDLVLSGLLSGFDVISAITRHTPPFKIIATSGAYREAVLDDIHPRLRVDAFVEKTRPGQPFNAAQWIQTVRRLLGTKGIPY
jgi:DNA-binding NtrC family response regulator